MNYTIEDSVIEVEFDSTNLTRSDKILANLKDSILTRANYNQVVRYLSLRGPEIREYYKKTIVALGKSVDSSNDTKVKDVKKLFMLIVKNQVTNTRVSKLKKEGDKILIAQKDLLVKEDSLESFLVNCDMYFDLVETNNTFYLKLECKDANYMVYKTIKGDINAIRLIR